MTLLDARFQTNQITVWRLGSRTSRGTPSYTLLGVFGATWKAGSGVRRDAQGIEFVPKDVYYVDQSAQIQRGDLVQRGDNSSSGPSGDVVRTTDRYDNSFFGQTDSFVVMTE